MVRNLLARNYIQIKETVDDLFREKKERIVTWAKEYTEEELGALLDRLKEHRPNMLCFADGSNGVKLKSKKGSGCV